MAKNVFFNNKIYILRAQTHNGHLKFIMYVPTEISFWYKKVHIWPFLYILEGLLAQN